MKEKPSYAIIVNCGGKTFYFKGNKEVSEPYKAKLMRFESTKDEVKTFKTLTSAENQLTKCQAYLDDYKLKGKAESPKAEITNFSNEQLFLF